jgi:hypothetical protein
MGLLGWVYRGLQFFTMAYKANAKNVFCVFFGFLVFCLVFYGFVVLFSLYF